MKHKLVFNNDLAKKLDSIKSDTKLIWDKGGYSCKEDLINKCILLLNEKFTKLNIDGFEFRSVLTKYDESSTYFGVLENETKVDVAYVFVIPPKYESRSAVLAQQVFPVLSGIIDKTKKTKSNYISNKPIFIINLNEVNHTAAMALNILSGNILCFNYIDIFDIDINELIVSKGGNPNIRCLKDYHNLIKKVSSDKANLIFEINEDAKSIKYLTNKIKDGIHVTNEPYWYVLKAYAAAYLAIEEGYKHDMSEFDKIERGNKTLNSFRDYIGKV